MTTTPTGPVHSPLLGWRSFTLYNLARDPGIGAKPLPSRDRLYGLGCYVDIDVAGGEGVHVGEDHGLGAVVGEGGFVVAADDGEGVEDVGGGEGLLAEGCGFAARLGVEYGDAVGKGGDAGVAAGGGGGGGAADGVGEGGEEQEAACGEGVAPGAGECAWRRGRGRGGQRRKGGGNQNGRVGAGAGAAAGRGTALRWGTGKPPTGVTGTARRARAGSSLLRTGPPGQWTEQEREVLAIPPAAQMRGIDRSVAIGLSSS